MVKKGPYTTKSTAGSHVILCWSTFPTCTVPESTWFGILLQTDIYSSYNQLRLNRIQFWSNQKCDWLLLWLYNQSMFCIISFHKFVSIHVWLIIQPEKWSVALVFDHVYLYPISLAQSNPHVVSINSCTFCDVWLLLSYTSCSTGEKSKHGI